jgi:hypothetical protein
MYFNFIYILYEEINTIITRTKITKVEKRRNEIFYKKKESILRKVNKLVVITSINIYLVIFKEG